MIFSTNTEVRAVYLESKIYFTAAVNLTRVAAVALNEDYFYCSSTIEARTPYHIAEDETIVKGIIGGKHEVIVTGGERLIIIIFINNYNFCKKNSHK